MKLSPFSINMYQQCPRRYKYHYIDGLIKQYRKPWPWLTMGTNVHDVLSDLMSIISVEQRNAETAEKLLREKWVRNREGFADAEEERDWGLKALAQLKSFVETQDMSIKPIMVERFHEVPLTRDLILMGKIDRVDQDEDGSLHIIDYKTGQVGENADIFQLLLYALILSKTVTYSVSKASYLYLSDGQMQTHLISDDNVETTRQAVIQIADRIKQDKVYPEVTGPLCKFCDFADICSAVNPQ